MSSFVISRSFFVGGSGIYTHSLQTAGATGAQGILERDSVLSTDVVLRHIPPSSPLERCVRGSLGSLSRVVGAAHEAPKLHGIGESIPIMDKIGAAVLAQRYEWP